MRTFTSWLARGIVVLAPLFTGLAPAASARPDEPPPPHQPAVPPSKPESPAKPEGEKDPPGDTLPSLDESLGLEKKSGDTAPARQPGGDLDRELLDQAPADDFAQAVKLMNQVAGRLESEKDTGLTTQRMQEEAIRRLDKMISEAKKQKQQKQKQKQQQQQKQQSQDQQKQQQQQQKNSQQKSQSSESRDQNQDNRGDVVDPAQRRDAALRQVSPGGTAAWGSLPEHIRSSLMQGFSDQFSSMYQSMTEAYYRRLAEDRGRDRKPASPDAAPGGSR